MCTPTERADIEAKEKKMKDFFSAMESNVLSNIAKGDPSGSLIDAEHKERRDSDLRHGEGVDKFKDDGGSGDSGFNRSSDDLPPPPGS